MNEEPKDIKSIFAEALEKKTPQDRAAYLDKACGGDADLRSKLESLLESHEQAGSFLEAPALDVTVTFDKSPLTEGPGTVIGPYKLLEKIGEGGMAYVYMAEQERPLRRRVALKIIKLGMDTKQVIARFEVERQALAVMDHPNIAKVFDAGATETGRPYFVMELVKGVSITEYCDKNKLSTKERLDLFIQVCNAVQHAHQKGIIHRDIKPSNVMVTLHDGKPVPKVIDFGIAKATIQRLTEKTLFTKYAQMIGTPEYMSPEQAEMSGLDIDTRADIYSLGVLLYELLTGTTPFDAEDLRSKGYGEMQRIIRETEPLKPSTKLSTMGEALTGVAEHRKTNPDLLAKLVRGDLDWIVMKTLEKDRTRRYETVGSLAADVKRHLNEEPVEAGPPGATYRIGKFIRKHRRTVAAIVAIAATLIIGLIVSTTLYFIANHARNQEAVARATAEHAQKAEQEQRKLAEEQRSLTETKAEDLRRSSYVNSIQLADFKYNERNISRVRELLNACPNDLRGWEWYRLNYISDQSLITLRGHRGWVDCAAISPDGKRIVSGGQTDHSIKVWDMATGRELVTIPEAHEDMVRCVSFSPDGKRLVSGSRDRTIKVWNAETGADVKTMHSDDYIECASISPDGKRIFSAGGEGQTIRVWDAETGETVKTFTGHMGGIWSLALSPDGKQLASGSWDGTIKVWDVESGTEAITLCGHEGQLYNVAFSPDGKRIASAGQEDHTIKIWDIATGKELITIPKAHDGLGLIYSVAFSPDNRHICSGSWDETIKVWDSATGQNVLTLPGHEGWVLSVAFSPDGKQIVSAGGADGTVKVWDVTMDHELTKLAGHRSSVSSIAFSPDGRRLVSGSQDGMVKLWDTRSLTELMTLRSSQEKAIIYSVAFSPNGRYVASGGSAQTFKIWDAANGSEMTTFHGHEGPIETVAFSPDGKHVASGSGDKTIRVWDVSSGKELMTLKGHDSGLICVAFSPDGKFIAAGSRDPNIRVWEWQTGRESPMLRGHSRGIILSVAFSPDGKRIVSACQEDHTVKVWDALTGAELTTLKHADVVISAAFSPDGKRVISGCRDKTARVWDATTGAELLTLRAESGVTTVAFDPDGKTIAAGTFDGLVVLWESAAPADGRDRHNGETARKIVDELYQKHGSYYEVIEKLHADTILDEPIHRLAMQIAASRKGEDAKKLVDELYKEHGSYREVIEKLQADRALDEPTYKLALEIAHSRKGEDAEKLTKKIGGELMKMFSSPGGDPNAHRAALEKAEEANRTDPNNLGILLMLALAQCRAGQYEDAIKTQAKAHNLEPNINMPPVLAFEAEAQYFTGNYKDAVRTLSEVLEISRRILGEQDRSTLDLMNQLACWQAGCPAAEVRNGAEAVKNATRACELTEWKEAMYLDTLAAAYAEVGDFESAVKWQKNGISLLTGKEPAEWPGQFDERLKLYQSGKPCRESP